jgi:ribonuclease HIII
MYDKSVDGDLLQCDMTQVLLHQEKYRNLLGDMNVQNILAQMHPTQSTFMDGMTDEQRFDCVIVDSIKESDEFIEIESNI